jgi:hypothetical protein
VLKKIGTQEEWYSVASMETGRAAGIHFEEGREQRKDAALQQAAVSRKPLCDGAADTNTCALKGPSPERQGCNLESK